MDRTGGVLEGIRQRGWEAYNVAACARQRGRRLCDLICSAPFWLGSFFRPWPMAPWHRQIQNHGSSRLTVPSAVGGSGEGWCGRESGGHETQAGQWGRQSLARFPRTNRAWREYPAAQRQITVRIANENRGRVALHPIPTAYDPWAHPSQSCAGCSRAASVGSRQARRWPWAHTAVQVQVL